MIVGEIGSILTTVREWGKMADSDEDVARLLKEYSSKPPAQHLTAEEVKELRDFILKNKSFRKLKDLIRINAWGHAVMDLNGDASEEDFRVKFAERQGRRRGMLEALNLLESLVEENDNE